MAAAGPKKFEALLRWLETISMNMRGYFLGLDDLGNGAPPHCDFRREPRGTLVGIQCYADCPLFTSQYPLNTKKYTNLWEPDPD